MLTICLLLLANHLRLVEGQRASSPDDWDLFNDYITTYGRHYATQSEKLYRFKVFQESLNRIASLNSQDPYQPYGVTMFCDLTESEFLERYLRDLPDSSTPPANRVSSFADLSMYRVEDLARTFDWRNVPNRVTLVKDQGPCDSSWAFSAVENIESVWAIEKRSVVNLSVQQILDCDVLSHGCSGGGTIEDAFDYVFRIGGLEREESYRYVAKDQQCSPGPFNPYASIDGFERVPIPNNTAMMLYLYNKAPLSICLDATSWQFYRGGVMTNRCGVSLNHCVLITGYDSTLTRSTSNWIVRNSWGTNWGENGYIYLDMYDVECGLATEAISAYILK